MKPSDAYDSLEVPRGLNLSSAHEWAIGRILDRLIEKCPAQFILLAETSGQLISVHGDKGKTDPSALGALIAGDLAAGQEIDRITAQRQRAQLTLREGPESTAFIAEVGEKMVLYMRIKKEVPLGWARLMLLEASRSVINVISASSGEVEKLDLNLGEDELDNLIGDGLDSIWHG